MVTGIDKVIKRIIASGDQTGTAIAIKKAKLKNFSSPALFGVDFATGVIVLRFPQISVKSNGTVGFFMPRFHPCAAQYSKRNCSWEGLFD